MKIMLRLLLFALSICIAQAGFAQSKTITGRVTSSDDGSAMPGVSVVVKGTTNGTSTDVDGRYSIQAAPGSVLVFSFIGALPQEHTIGAANTIDVRLGSDAKALDEVVVVGYGTQKRSDVTSAVSTVDTKVLESRPVTDVGRALQGTTPGLTITSPTGQIGQNPTINLRGMAGTLSGGGGAQPLILVDNVEVPSLQLVNPEDIESISVLKDAASASIYGARAAWGVILITTKTGKKGAPTRVNYNNNFSWNRPTQTAEMANAADAGEMALASARRTNPNLTEMGIVGVYFDDVAIQKIRDWEQQYGGQDLGPEMVMGRDFEVRNGRLFFYRTWDPADMFIREWTPMQKHDLSVSGGSEKTTFRIGAGFLGQQGVLKVNPDEFNRYTLNLNVTTAVTDWLDTRARVLYANTLTTEPFNYGSATYDPWFYLFRWPGNFPYGTYEGRPFRSAITEVEQAKMNDNRTSLSRIAVGGTLKPMPGLTVDADFTYNNTSGQVHQTGGAVTAYNYWTGGGTWPYGPYTTAAYDKVRYENSRREMLTGKAFATYVKDVNDHSFKVIAGGDVEEMEYWWNYAERRGLLNPDQGELPLATGDQLVGGNRDKWTTLGFFGRINYSFKNKYLLEVNGRYDGSSRLSRAQKWGFFPSMSAGYVISEESFMEFTQPVLTFLKLRGSWGSIGNQNANINNIYSTMTPGTSGWVIGGVNTAQVGTPSYIQEALTWETVTTLDFGLDSRFFRDKFGITFDWYQRKTTDIHSAGEVLPVTLGAPVPLRNFGELTTTGWELAVDFTHEFKNNLRFTATAMLSDFKEEVTEFANNTGLTANRPGRVLGEIWGFETDRYFTKDDFRQDANGNLILQNGKYVLKEGIATQTLFENAGFFYGPGDIKFKDLNGDGKIDRGSGTVTNPGDQKVIGNSTPRYQYGLRLGAEWKGFDLSVFFQGVGKRDFWGSGQIIIPGFRAGEATYFAHQTDYWTEENPNAFYPRPTDAEQSTAFRNFLPQTKYLLDLSYMRVKNLAIGYTLPQTLTRRAKLERVRVYFSGENLLTFDNLGDIPIDPEVNYTTSGLNDPATFGRVYPYQTNLSFGLQVTL
ncbi:TonB-dependent receptor [Rufibacter sp. XAAS-G3-1]|uniref:SusC/RagA family TonB-linked outer membrane protein n=1 Tax=Rufibacter sp. XAAS-G3-1 TaxID=2729134 RepID=UPI0015E78173|nr:TonB-dependent receptor [Rufibacter sp. XAAS-G3-1]